ncbi:tli-1 [Pristionchus pacificus]|uniref:Tli-1 n=1 Tax=Pristionchus pacificus TaxID=54126 RepID=A0A454Y2G3_PRIPA|nr:tli-1 [Pristionchus pacificus]|eukprot:PDM65139.1 tli-1 [Pristionchus pacificus]
MSLNPTVAERRRQVLVGPLPDDFLRLIKPSSSSTAEAAPYDPATAAHVATPTQPAFHSFVPPNTRGRISVTILEANLAKNYGLVRMDPYCRLRVGHASFETPTKLSGGRTPFWNRIVHAYLPVGVDSIFVQIFDEKAFSADECIAHSHIILPPGIFNGETIDEFYPLTGAQGEGKEGLVHLIISFAPVEAPNAHPTYQGGPTHPDGSPTHGAEVPAAVTGPAFSDDDVKAVKELFPDIDEEVVRAVLEENRGNQDATVSALLEMTK